MRCLVPVKRVIDFNVKVRLKADKSGVETENVKMSINPFDEIALEEALRLKEKGVISEILAVSIGTSKETLYGALARGADRAVLIASEEAFEPLNIAKILQVLVLKEKINLVLMGKQAIDDDCNQTGQMLAGLLNWSQGTFVSKVNYLPEIKAFEVTREVDGGLETIEVTLPTVLTTDLRLNMPRYVSLPNVMKAKSKPLTSMPLTELGLNLKKRTEILKFETPPLKRKGVIVKDVGELLDKLHQEAKVI